MPANPSFSARFTAAALRTVTTPALPVAWPSASASRRCTGAHDVYKKGEWAIQDGKFTKANQDTAYSLAEYPQAWDVEE